MSTATATATVTAQDLKEFEPRVKYFARIYRVPGYEIEDLEQEARICVVRALDAFVEGASRTALVDTYIRNRIFDLLRQAGVGSEEDRDYGNLCSDALDIQSNEEISLVSLDEEIGEDDGGSPMTRHDVIGVPASQENAHQLDRYALWLESLTERDRIIVADHALGLSHRQIANKLKISKTEVHRLWKQAQDGRPS